MRVPTHYTPTPWFDSKVKKIVFFPSQLQNEKNIVQNIKHAALYYIIVN